jgi:hypothetical protein
VSTANFRRNDKAAILGITAEMRRLAMRGPLSSAIALTFARLLEIYVSPAEPGENPIPMMPFDDAMEVIKEGKITLTPDLAATILNKTYFDGRQPMAGAHARLLADVTEHACWHQGSQICFGRLDGVLHLVNGVHLCVACVETGKSASAWVDILDVPDEAELKQLWHFFNHVKRFDNVQRHWRPI